MIKRKDIIISGLLQVLLFLLLGAFCSSDEHEEEKLHPQVDTRCNIWARPSDAVSQQCLPEFFKVDYMGEYHTMIMQRPL
jgi:hypothetical protein